jgi:MFS family permease
VRRRWPLYGLLAGSTISWLGTAMTAVALPWLVLVETGSASRTGIVGFTQMAPYVLLHATAGPLVDRFGARRSAIGGDLAAAAVIAVVPALYAADRLGFAALAVLVGLAGAARGVADCATNPLVPAAAVRCDVPLERAAGLASSGSRAGMLLGAPLAGVLIGWTDPATVLLADAASFAVAAVLVALSTPRVVRSETGEPAEPLTLRTYRQQLAQGLRFLWADRLLMGIVTMVAVTNLIDVALASVVLPVWVRDEIGSAAALGLIFAVSDAAALAGMLITSWLGPRLSRRWLYSIGFLIGGSPRFFALALVTTVPPVLIVAAISGIAAGSLNPIIGAVSYERVPARLQARVLSAIRASAWVGIPLGSLLGGLLVAGLGVRWTLAMLGSAYLLTTLAPFAFPAWRGLERPDPTATTTQQAEPTASPAIPAHPTPPSPHPAPPVR